jgi:formamidopyrimidine-DNA glycosylase
MPELPEVETMRRGVLAIGGQQIRDVTCPPSDCKPILIHPPVAELNRRLRGRVVTAVDRLGKRVVVRIDSGDALVIEPRMTGLVLLAGPAAREANPPPTQAHLRLRLRFRGGSELLFWDRRGLGTVRLLSAKQVWQLEHELLGPDALQITLDQLRGRLRTSRRPIKVALLDQAAVAGIGNLYASELLFVAGVDPRTRCDRLSGPQWQRIHAALQAVLREAIAHEGSTLSDGTYRNALNQQGGYQNYHRVYDREGQRCGRCGQAEIRRIVQAQRSTFFCPVCQRRSGCHARVARIQVSPPLLQPVQ